VEYSKKRKAKIITEAEGVKMGYFGLGKQRRED